jgi:NAD+ synthase
LNYTGASQHITSWLNDYCESSMLSGFIIGISGGIDSALTSTLCAATGKKTILVNMPIRQSQSEYVRASNHITDLKTRFSNVESIEINLTSIFEQFEATLPNDTVENQLAMANTRARLRMTTLYALGQTHACLVAGTGNKIEDFGVGFFTKYGDGGVDLSPIADLTKSEVKLMAKELSVIQEILDAKPTDGLWGDSRTDEDQLGASYPELEWAMAFTGDENKLTTREQEVITIYRRLNRINKHKMEPIPVCFIPQELK